MTKNRTEVADIDRSLYDFTYGEEGFERLDAGITPDIVREISAKKDEPQWMLDLRLKSLEIFNRFPDPTWGPSIEGLDMDNIVTYVKPNTDQKHDWESVPDDIKNTFERLGIPEAERSYLAGVGAQYDSELVYHNMQDTASKMGIVYSGIEEALHDPQWEPLIHEKFMTLIPPTDHKFAALHGAVWSGGSFVYVPKGTKLDFPLQSYFRLNAKGAGQFEHTLIIVEDDADLHFIEGCSAPKYNVANLHAGAVELFVGKRAHLRYSTIENWSKNMYNLNTKRARVDEDGDITKDSNSCLLTYELQEMTAGLKVLDAGIRDRYESSFTEPYFTLTAQAEGEGFLVEVSFFLPNTMDGDDTAEVAAHFSKADMRALLDELDKLCKKFPDRT